MPTKRSAKAQAQGSSREERSVHTREDTGSIPVPASTTWKQLRQDPDTALAYICQHIEAGETISAIAKELGTFHSHISAWLGENQYRSARANVARAKSARYWDDRAQTMIEEASDAFELAKAKELAHHFRWRASKIAPSDYGDRLRVDGELSIRDVSDDELTAKAARLLALIGSSTPGTNGGQ